ncbi:MAG: ATP-binding protein, partial [Bacteroidota bacterium]|nr:ATP-binding protein [Bacteroidota bacterium]
MKLLKESAINLETLKPIKYVYLSALTYLKEIILFIILTDVPFFVIGIDKFNFTLLLVINIITLFILIYLIGRKRNSEIAEIREIITNISNNGYNDNSEIKLSSNLLLLEEDIRRMYEKNQSDIAYLKKLEKMRTQFIGNVSHELRTPIFAVQGYLETLLNGAINDPKVNITFLEKAISNTQNLNNLLNDLIDISMIESGEMRMSFRYFNLREFLMPVVDDLKYLAENKGISLDLVILNEKLTVFGDKSRLRQVLNNLIQNAIKYTDAGKVEIVVEEESRSVTIKVKDTGIGIPKEDINRIFERFYRVDKARSREVGGTGLGLAICKHIIEA